MNCLSKFDFAKLFALPHHIFAYIYFSTFLFELFFLFLFSCKYKSLKGVNRKQIKNMAAKLGEMRHNIVVCAFISSMIGINVENTILLI